MRDVGDAAAGLDEIENLAPKLRRVTRSCHSSLLMSDIRIQELQPHRTRGTPGSEVVVDALRDIAWTTKVDRDGVLARS
jgi:hypothetical protein